MDTPFITSFRLADGIDLRVFHEDDAEAVFATVSRNEDHLMTFMHWMTPEYSMDSAREFVRRAVSSVKAGENLGYGIFRQGRLIGSIGFTHFDLKSRKTEIGYWIDKAEEGKGIVSAACGLLIEYAFGQLGLNRIEIRCSTFNVRSAAIPERLGFKKEGVLRQSEFRNGRLHDFSVYGLLAAEWQNREI